MHSSTPLPHSLACPTILIICMAPSVRILYRIIMKRQLSCPEDFKSQPKLQHREATEERQGGGSKDNREGYMFHSFASSSFIYMQVQPSGNCKTDPLLFQAVQEAPCQSLWVLRSQDGHCAATSNNKEKRAMALHGPHRAPRTAKSSLTSFEIVEKSMLKLPFINSPWTTRGWKSHNHVKVRFQHTAPNTQCLVTICLWFFSGPVLSQSSSHCYPKSSCLRDSTLSPRSTPF